MSIISFSTASGANFLPCISCLVINSFFPLGVLIDSTVDALPSNPPNKLAKVLCLFIKVVGAKLGSVAQS